MDKNEILDIVTFLCKRKFSMAKVLIEIEDRYKERIFQASAFLHYISGVLDMAEAMGALTEEERAKLYFLLQKSIMEVSRDKSSAQMPF